MIAARGDAADYKDTYKQGVEAAEKGRWADVARLMQQSIAGKPAEGETIRFYGQRFEPYLPHYYLGLALSNTGDCEGALRSFGISESQGAVRKSGDQYRQLVKSRDACQTRVAGTAKPASPKPSAGPDPAAVAAAVQSAEAAMGRADEAARAVSSLQTDALLTPIWSQEPGLGPNQEKAKTALAAARGQLDTARRKPDLAQIADAQEQATRAAAQFDAVRTHATLKRDEAKKAADARVAADKATPKPLALTPTQQGPPAELLAGAQAFFGAQYQQAADLLGRAEGLTGRAGAQSLVIRAAARHALYLVGGERDSALLARAAADVKASRERDPQVAPDPKAFSPRFVEFFAKSR
jgi:hypothetical protein